MVGFRVLNYEQVRETGERIALLNECKARLDPKELLEYYGVRGLYQQGPELIHSCLIDRVDPHHMNGDQNPSASLNIKKMKYNCYAWGGGSVLWFIQKMEGTDHNGMLEILGKFLQEGVSSVESLLERLNACFVQEQRVVEIPKYNDRVLDTWLQLHPYLTEDRRLAPEVLMNYHVGYDESRTRIVLPHYWENKLVGWQLRKLDSPKWPKTPEFEKVGDRLVPTSKYKNSPQFPKFETLFNYDKIRERKCKTVVVVESVMSVLMAETFNYQSLPSSYQTGSWNMWDCFLSTFGSKNTDTHADYLREFERVIVWFDDDFGGWTGAYKLVTGLYKFTNVWVVLEKTRKDLADMTKEEAQEILPKAVPASLALIELELRINAFKALRREKARGGGQ